MGNETYRIEVSSPLIRPGLKIVVEGVSERYLVPVMHNLLDYVREFNKNESEKRISKLEEKTE